MKIRKVQLYRDGETLNIEDWTPYGEPFVVRDDVFIILTKYEEPEEKE